LAPADTELNRRVPFPPKGYPPFLSWGCGSRSECLRAQSERLGAAIAAEEFVARRPLADAAATRGFLGTLTSSRKNRGVGVGASPPPTRFEEMPLSPLHSDPRKVPDTPHASELLGPPASFEVDGWVSRIYPLSPPPPPSQEPLGSALRCAQAAAAEVAAETRRLSSELQAGSLAVAERSEVGSAPSYVWVVWAEGLPSPRRGGDCILPRVRQGRPSSLLIS